MKFLLRRGFKIEHLGFQGERLAEAYLIRRGRYSIRNFANRMRTFFSWRSPKRYPKDSAIELLWQSRCFSVSIPSICKVGTCRDSFSLPLLPSFPTTALEASMVAARINLSWTEAPEKLWIEFPN